VWRSIEGVNGSEESEEAGKKKVKEKEGLVVFLPNFVYVEMSEFSDILVQSKDCEDRKILI
jgi:hypothetical protein